MGTPEACISCRVTKIDFGDDRGMAFLARKSAQSAISTLYRQSEAVSRICGLHLVRHQRCSAVTHAAVGHASLMLSRLIKAPPTRSVTLLASSQARSDDVEADSFEQPLVAPAVHPFTGTFAASEHTVAFGSKAFRLAFPLHVVALALLVFTQGVSAMSGTVYLFILLLLALGLGARIALHR